MEEINELIKRYHLEEDLEHVIIPLPDAKGTGRRCFLLKRRFIRIVYPDGHYVDYPLAEAIEATVRYPELLLSEALYLLHKARDAQRIENTENEKELRSNGKEDTYKRPAF
ncbi:MAG: hypothetical protein K8I29_18030 [Alphaproteobacteria bacterium]|uniref:Uncharacterized protein n=1 Tax=Candidatus Nitrobium versatile TaxID=2884831 RepID=A0A953M360_9BACT|nr:hypothetical protein [Candidatus Nitrobium versatile]